MNFELQRKKITLLAASSLVALALSGCGGDSGGYSVDISEDYEEYYDNTYTSTNYHAYVPLKLDERGQIAGEYLCSEETQDETMYRIDSFYGFSSFDECTQSLKEWVDDFNKDETPATEKQQEGLAFINEIRKGAGLPLFHGNRILERAAKNHELYIGDVMNTHNVEIGHYENNASYPSEYYTGIEPKDRAWHEGYEGEWSSEVLTQGYSSITPKGSLMLLMPMIYHRQALLYDYMNEIGIGGTPNDFKYKAEVHVIGMKVKKVGYLRALSPKMVVYPYENQKEVRISFDNNECPDPLPDITKSVGNPISVFFNSTKTKEITVRSFRLFEDESNEEMTDTRILDKESDPNRYFSKYDFALFPMKKLKTDTTYRVEFEYIENGEDKKRVWKFTTRSW